MGILIFTLARGRLKGGVCMGSLAAGRAVCQVVRPIPVRLDGRIVGVVVGSEYRRTLQERHVLRLPRPAVAVSPAVLDEAERIGATVGVWTLPSGAAAVMALTEFRRLATPIDRGHGPQLALAIDRFFTARVQAAPPTAEQLALFMVAGR